MLTVNGKQISLTEPVTVADYLEQNKYVPSQIAVELNEEILSRSEYSHTFLKNGDIMEIVSFMGGGCQ